MNFTVREATLEDAQLIADLTRACWAKRVALCSSGHRETAVCVRQHLQEGGGYILMHGEEAIGSVRWLPLEGQAQVWETLRIGVLPQYAGEGLSQHLVEAVIHRALAAGVTELRLAVRSDQERLLGLYATYGFEFAPELEYAHTNPVEPAPHVMRKLLLH
ncbi:MAG TPA: GNAT family N-acetyltransferase [Noviherbaspirillum sp.]